MNDTADGSPQKKLSSGPKTRVCYVCGRQYGLHSFEIHLKQCKELWIAREAEKDPRERKKLPEDPMLRYTSTAADGTVVLPTEKELEEINRASTQAFNTEALDTCEYCGRTFLPEKLLIHNRSCTAEHPARRLTDAVKRSGGASGASGYSPAPTPTKSAPTESPSPYRPSSSSKPRSASKATRNSVNSSTEGSEMDGVTNLRVEDGSLVGHLGGTSGRPLRHNGAKSASSPSVNSGGGNARRPDVFNISEFADKEEVIQYLVDKIETMELTVADLNRSIIEVKSVVQQLR